MRLFIGIPLSDRLRAKVAAAARDWRELAPDLKWVEPDLYHLTLQFLGEVDDARWTPLAEALAALAGRSGFRLRLGGAMTLPRGRRARVLALGVTRGWEELAALAGAVAEATGRLDFPREERAFKSHLTLARARRGQILPRALDPRRLAAPELPALDVREFHLFESQLRPDGPLYASLARVELTAPPGAP
ncbi:MAG: RNA 2',3'-cyclic phosphodiesterase, partial [Candidatus Krumholzibacteriota bacterium]|nr:RNA 2',3'-cyclic phosphodiesterase [Candidatus Krumholzibacteriota bacterium]